MELDEERREPPKDEQIGKDAENPIELLLDDLESIAEREDSPTQADGLDWVELAIELKNLFKFNTENRPWLTILKTSLIIFATSLVPSLFDMGSDAFSTYNFINGTTYTKYVPDLNHPSVNSSRCVHIGTYLRWDGNSSEVVYEEVECFERDPIWGYMSLVFIFLPGIVGAMIWDSGPYYALCCLTLPIFPIFVLAVKTLGLFNPGQNWKILARRCAQAEGLCESQFQFLLQLFIVFSRADRAPSAVQLGTMASSVMMFAISSLDDIRRKQKTVELGDDVRRAIDLLPQILVGNVFSLGYLALLATLLRYWVLLPLVLYLAAWVIFFGYLWCQPKYRKMIDDDTNGRVTVGLIEMNASDIAKGLFGLMVFLVLTLLLTGLTITANVYPSLELPGLAWEVSLNNVCFTIQVFLNRSTVSPTWLLWRRSTCSTPSMLSPSPRIS